MLKESPEIPGRLYTPEFLAKEEKKTRRMEYHTERIVTLHMSAVFSNTLVAVAIIVGISFVLGMLFSH